jgi:hypothetical protein
VTATEDARFWSELAKTQRLVALYAEHHELHAVHRRGDNVGAALH